MHMHHGGTPRTQLDHASKCFWRLPLASCYLRERCRLLAGWHTYEQGWQRHQPPRCLTSFEVERLNSLGGSRGMPKKDISNLPWKQCKCRSERCSWTQETIGPDPHTPGAELPPSVYAADIGYLVDGTPLDAAGNNAVHWDRLVWGLRF